MGAVMGLPWRQPALKDWSIVGCNHYRQAGKRCLFVAMTRSGRCITAEGDNEAEVFVALAQQAARLNRECERAEAAPALPAGLGA